MFFSERFICASFEKNQYEKHINAPLFRRVFDLPKKVRSHMQICGLGFYRVFINGKELTKGKLAPYLSNTDDVVYYDTYDIEKYIKKGQNILTVLLGNGLQNGIGGEIFGFDKASWSSSPKLAVALFVDNKILFEADEKFEWCNSPIHPIMIYIRRMLRSTFRVNERSSYIETSHCHGKGSNAK